MTFKALHQELQRPTRSWHPSKRDGRKVVDGNCSTPATTDKNRRQCTHASTYFKNISKPNSQ